MMRRITPALLVLVCSVTAATVACGRGSEEPSPTTDLSRMTVADAYARLADAIGRDGKVLHVEMNVSAQQGADQELRPYYTTELWIDAATHALRMEYRLDPSVDSYDQATSATTIVVGPYEYVPDDPGEALRSDVKAFCPQNADPLIAYLLECAGLQLRQEAAAATARVEPAAQYEGQPAAALVFDVNGNVFKGAFTTHLDPSTFLPIARTAEPDGGSFPRSVVQYQNEFVDASSLDPSTFDPHSIGYGAEDEQAKLDTLARAVPVWWLGSEFKPASPWDELVLTRIDLPDAGPWGADGHMIYETPGGLQGADVLLWTPAHFDAFMKSDKASVLVDPLCVTHTTMKIGARDVDLYAIPWPEPPVNTAPKTPKEACPIRIVDAVLQGWSYMAVIRMDDVVVDVRIPEPAGHAYATEDGIRVLVEALRARPARVTESRAATIEAPATVRPAPVTVVPMTPRPAVTATRPPAR